MLHPFLAVFPGDAIPSLNAQDIEKALYFNKCFSDLRVPPVDYKYEDAQNNIELINASFNDQRIDMSTLPLCFCIFVFYVMLTG